MHWPPNVVGDSSVHLALGIHLTLWSCVGMTFGLGQRLAKIAAGSRTWEPPVRHSEDQVERGPWQGRG